jgi:hypothetical protein
MSDRFTLPDNASVFNLKRAHNGLSDAVVESGFQNLLKNPDFKGLRAGITYGWNGDGTSLWNASYDLSGQRIITLDDTQSFHQHFTDLKLNTTYTLAVLCDSIESMSIEISGGVDDFTDISGSAAPVTGSTTPGISLTVLRITTRETAVDSTTLFNDSLQVTFTNDSGVTVPVTVRGIVLVEGELDLPYLVDNEWSRSIRFTDSSTGGYWQLTADGTSWERIWSENNEFIARVGLIVSDQMVSYIHQDNIIGGAGITVTPGVAVDGTTPTLTFDATAAGGSGLGDWTREDVTYQSALEHSDFRYLTYDKLNATGTVVLVGAASQLTNEDDYGTGRVQGGSGSGLETKDLIQDGTGNHLSYYLQVITDGQVDARRQISADGITWSAWADTTANTLIVDSTAFNHIKFELTFSGAGSKNIFSYGLLYGSQMASAGDTVRMFETYEVPADATAGTILAIPNGQFYHADGESLNIHYNRAKLINTVDYDEIIQTDGLGQEVLFNIALDATATIVFSEYYGKVDESVESWNRMNTNHTIGGAHEQVITNLYVDATGSDLNAGTSEAQAFQTIDKALNNVNSLGTTVINLHANQTFSVVENHYYQYVDLNIKAYGVGTDPNILFESYTTVGLQNTWYYIGARNGSILFSGVNVDSDNPSISGNADSSVKGIIGSIEYSNLDVHFNACTVNLYGCEICKLANNQIVDFTFTDSILQTSHAVRTMPVIDFNDQLGGLQLTNTSLIGGYTTETDAFIGLVNAAANIRSNIESLAVDAVGVKDFEGTIGAVSKPSGTTSALVWTGNLTNDSAVDEYFVIDIYAWGFDTNAAGADSFVVTLGIYLDGVLIGSVANSAAGGGVGKAVTVFKFPAGSFKFPAGSGVRTVEAHLSNVFSLTGVMAGAIVKLVKIGTAAPSPTVIS